MGGTVLPSRCKRYTYPEVRTGPLSGVGAPLPAQRATARVEVERKLKEEAQVRCRPLVRWRTRWQGEWQGNQADGHWVRRVRVQVRAQREVEERQRAEQRAEGTAEELGRAEAALAEAEVQAQASFEALKQKESLLAAADDELRRAQSDVRPHSTVPTAQHLPATGGAQCRGVCGVRLVSRRSSAGCRAPGGCAHPRGAAPRAGRG
jgi:hypothetical protein